MFCDTGETSFCFLFSFSFFRSSQCRIGIYAFLLEQAQQKNVANGLDKNSIAFASKLLMGKHKSSFTPGVDSGDFVIVVNSSKVSVSGNKASQKIYHKHTGYPGGIKSTSFEQMLKRNPNFIIKNAVRGMLPKGPLGRSMLKKLKIYDGLNHPHNSQNPANFNIG